MLAGVTEVWASAARFAVIDPLGQEPEIELAEAVLNVVGDFVHHQLGDQASVGGNTGDRASPVGTTDGPKLQAGDIGRFLSNAEVGIDTATDFGKHEATIDFE